MARIDYRYRRIMREILEVGMEYEDPNRKGTHRTQIPVFSLEHDMDEFPAVTTKKLQWKSVVGELIWFLRGDTNIKFLVDNGINIWNKDTYNHLTKGGYRGSFDEYLKLCAEHDFVGVGNAGRIYGGQWRSWSSPGKTFRNGTNLNQYHIDQIYNLMQDLKNKPFSTEHIVTAWNPAEKEDMALPPCHFGFQVMCYPLDGKIGFDLIWDQRSVDTFLGLPFNIASYGLLMEIIGKLTGYIPGTLHGSLRNVHLYDNSYDEALIQSVRDPKAFKAPKLVFSEHFDTIVRRYRAGDITLDGFFTKLQVTDCILENYNSYDSIKVEMLSRD